MWNWARWGSRRTASRHALLWSGDILGALEALGAARRLAAIAGDLETERDAVRLRGAGIPAAAITTGSACHLDAAMVEGAGLLSTMMWGLRAAHRWDDARGCLTFRETERVDGAFAQHGAGVKSLAKALARAENLTIIGGGGYCFPAVRTAELLSQIAGVAPTMPVDLDR